MGVEYAHGLFVPDLDWRPTWGHVGAVHEVFAKWKLATARQKVSLHEIGNAGTIAIDAKRAAKAMPANLISMYGEIKGGRAVELVGASRYAIKDSQRYISSIMVVLGVDFKLVSNDSFEVEVTTPAKNGKVPVEIEDDLVTGQPVFRASWTTKPPNTRRPRGSTFSGVWRSGIIIDCGKDLPAIDEGEPLPAKGFRAGLEKALGTKLVEVGWYH